MFMQVSYRKRMSTIHLKEREASKMSLTVSFAGIIQTL